MRGKDNATHGYVFNQTMLRIADPKRSLDFYTRVMGMTLIKRLDFEEMQFSLYFLAAGEDFSDISEDDNTRMQQTFGRPAMLELTHNWGIHPKRCNITMAIANLKGLVISAFMYRMQKQHVRDFHRLA